MRSDNMMALHANNHYHYSNKVVSGTNQTVEHTYNADIGCVIEGQTEQETSVQGANLLDLEKLMKNPVYIKNANITQVDNETGSVTVTPINAIAWARAEYYFDLPTGNYFIRHDGIQDFPCNSTTLFSNGVVKISKIDTSGVETNVAEARKTNNNKATFSVEEGYRYKIVFYTSLDVPSDTVKIYTGVQISSTDVDFTPFVPDSPSPDYPQPIQSAKGSVTSEGRNLLDSSFIDLSGTKSGITYTKQSDGQYRIYGTHVEGISSSTTITIPTDKRQEFSAGTYSIDRRTINGYDIEFFAQARTLDGTFIRNIDGSNIIINTPFKISSVGIYFNNNITTPVDFIISTQLELGSVATPYQPYQTPTTAQSAYPLYEGDKWLVGDKYVLDKAVYEFNSSEKFVLENTGDDYIECYVNIPDKMYGITNFKCSTFVNSNSPFTPINSVCGRVKNNAISFCLDVNRFPTVDKFKSFLASQHSAGTPVTIVYQRATPLEIPDTQSLKSHPHHTDLSATAEAGYLLPSNVECTYKVYKE